MGTTFCNIQLLNKSKKSEEDIKALLVSYAKSRGLYPVQEGEAEVLWKWHIQPDSEFAGLYLPLEQIGEPDFLPALFEKLQMPVIFVYVFDSDVAFAQLCDSSGGECFRMVYDPADELAGSVQGSDDAGGWYPYLLPQYGKEDIERIKEKEYVFSEEMIYDLFTLLGMELGQLSSAFDEDNEDMNVLFLA